MCHTVSGTQRMRLVDQALEGTTPASLWPNEKTPFELPSVEMALLPSMVVALADQCKQQ